MVHKAAGDMPLPTRAKIVATLGPASEAPEMVRRLIEAGVSVFRLNFSHGDLAAHLKRLMTVRAVSAEMARPVAVLGDLCGPKIRVGRLEQPVTLEAGQDVILRVGDGPRMPGTSVFPVTYPRLVEEVNPGQRVLINDGAVRMLAVERDGSGGLRCRVTLGGVVSSGKGINLPESDVSAPAITAEDWKNVEWAVEHGLDYLALSFVRRAEEVRELKARAGTTPVIAKIEKPQALADLERILDAADGAMVARGDLGVEMDLAQVPVAQKRIVAMAQDFGKPCIVATQMLESMIEHATPTRAEASDVANAVFDGADAVMLSGETAVGKHPSLTAETMRRIIAATEECMAAKPLRDSPPARLVASRYATAALAHGAWHVATDIGARLVVCWSEAGGTARYLSQNDFRVPIVAYSTSALATRRMALLRGVTAIHAPAPATLGGFTDLAERDMLARGWVREGEPIILLAGKPLGQVKATNSMAVLYVGDSSGGYRAHKS